MLEYSLKDNKICFLLLKLSSSNSISLNIIEAIQFIWERCKTYWRNKKI